MNLTEVQEGRLYRIKSLPDREIRAQALRFGIAEGEIITCTTVVPGGPVLIQKNRQEIALGRGLAARIEAEEVPLSSLPAQHQRRRNQHGMPWRHL